MIIPPAITIPTLLDCLYTKPGNNIAQRELIFFMAILPRAIPHITQLGEPIQVTGTWLAKSFVILAILSEKRKVRAT
jgi:hypothetical protein